MYRFKIWSFIAALLLCSQAFGYEVIAPENNKAVTQLVDNVFIRLPKKMQDALKKEDLKITFEGPVLGAEKYKSLCAEVGKKGEHVIGLAERSFFGSSYKIKLHPLIASVLQNENTEISEQKCGNTTVGELARHTLVHEFAHIYDYLNIENPWQENLRRRCESESMSADTNGSMSQECNAALAKRTTISESQAYLKMTGWNQGLGVFEQKNKGQDFVGKDGKVKQIAPRGLFAENSDLLEHFAVNFERFIYDKNYSCHRPAMYQYFVEHFGEDPVADRDCKINYDINYSTNGAKTSLDPKRVYQVHYLLADKGDSLMSRWGHAMLRVVVCAPERKTVGPDCLKDTKHHMVLSYRANLKDIQVDYKGLVVGDKYPIQLFVLPFKDVTEEYTRLELRDIVSIPLKLNDEEKAKLLNQTLEQYWDYAGRYAFLSANCATEARDLIQSVLPEQHVFRSVSAISPVGLQEDLNAAGILDLGFVEREKNKVNSDYYYPSYAKTITNSLARLKKEGVISPEINIDSYVNKSAEDRKKIFEEAIKATEHKKVIAGHFYLIEGFIRRKHDADLLKKSQELALKKDDNKKINAIVDGDAFKKVKDMLEARERWKLADYGYGVPLANQVRDVEAIWKKQQKEMDKSLEKVAVLLGDIFKTEIFERNKSVENLDCFYEAYQEAKRAER